MAAFCRERGLCAPYFYAWKKRLREAAAGRDVLRAPLTKFVEVQVAPGGPDPHVILRKGEKILWGVHFSLDML